MAIERVFRGADAYMVESARTILEHLEADLADFTDFSSRYDAAFVADYEAKVDNADTVATDDSMESQLMTKTATMEGLMSQARAIYNKAKRYAELTFSGSPATIHEFTRGYGEARRSQAKMIVFLEMLESALTRHTTALTDATLGGMPATFPSKVAALRTNFQNTNVDQEVFAGERVVSTEERILTMNACYRMMADVCATAQIIYEDSPAKQTVYSYRPYVDSKDGQEFSGTLAPGATLAITELPYKAVQILNFENKGMVKLLFDLVEASVADDPAFMEGNIVDLAAGGISSHAMEWLNTGIPEDKPMKILVHNPSATTDGKYSVQMDSE